MNTDLYDLMRSQGGVVTSAQALTYLSRRRFRYAVEDCELYQVWHGIYGAVEPDTGLRLRGLGRVS